MLSRKSSKERSEPSVRAALDIGTEYLKAVIVENKGGIPHIIGASRVAQDYSNMEGGAIADISGVAAKAAQALKEAGVLAKKNPKEIVVGLAGELVKGIAKTVNVTRRRPEKPITLHELRKLVAGIQKQGLEDVRSQILEETGYNQVDIELVNSAVVNMRIDGYKVSNPFDFQGRNLEATVFAAYAPLVHIGAIRSIARQIGCNLVNAVTEPYAVASATLTDEVYEFGSLIVDVGGGSTDIALIQNRGIVGTKMVAFGGRAFTKSIAADLGISLKQAEELKLDYARGTLSQEEWEKVSSIIDNDLKIYTQAIMVALADLTHGQLPPTVALCGGGSSLPGLAAIFSSPEMENSGLFAAAPSVHKLSPQEVIGIEDDKQLLVDTVDVTPKCLAFNTFVEQGVDGLLATDNEEEVYHGASRARHLSR